MLSALPGGCARRSLRSNSSPNCSPTIASAALSAAPRRGASKRSARRRCDLPIELWDGLGPDADSANIVRCFSAPAFADAVFCTHGEVVSPLLDSPAFRTLMRDTGYSRAKLLTKGTAWRLRLTPKGQVIGFKHLSTG